MTLSTKVLNLGLLTEHEAQPWYPKGKNFIMIVQHHRDKNGRLISWISEKK